MLWLAGLKNGANIKTYTRIKINCFLLSLEAVEENSGECVSTFTTCFEKHELCVYKQLRKQSFNDKTKSRLTK